MNCLMFCQILEFMRVLWYKNYCQVSDVADMPYVNFVLPPTHLSMNSTHNNTEFSTSDQVTDEWSKFICITNDINKFSGEQCGPQAFCFTSVWIFQWKKRTVGSLKYFFEQEKLQLPQILTSKS